MIERAPINLLSLSSYKLIGGFIFSLMLPYKERSLSCINQQTEVIFNL